MFLSVMEVAICVVFVAFLVTQVFIPLEKGRALFPILRKERKLRADLVQVNQAVAEKEIEKEITKTKEKGGV